MASSSSGAGAPSGSDEHSAAPGVGILGIAAHAGLALQDGAGSLSSVHVRDVPGRVDPTVPGQVDLAVPGRVDQHLAVPGRVDQQLAVPGHVDQLAVPGRVDQAVPGRVDQQAMPGRVDQTAVPGSVAVRSGAFSRAVARSAVPSVPSEPTAEEQAAHQRELDAMSSMNPTAQGTGVFIDGEEMFTDNTLRPPQGLPTTFAPAGNSTAQAGSSSLPSRRVRPESDSASTAPATQRLRSDDPIVADPAYHTPLPTAGLDPALRQELENEQRRLADSHAALAAQQQEIEQARQQLLDRERELRSQRDVQETAQQYLQSERAALEYDWTQVQDQLRQERLQIQGQLQQERQHMATALQHIQDDRMLNAQVLQAAAQSASPVVSPSPNVDEHFQAPTAPQHQAPQQFGIGTPPDLSTATGDRIDALEAKVQRLLDALSDSESRAQAFSDEARTLRIKTGNLEAENGALIEDLEARPVRSKASASSFVSANTLNETSGPPPKAPPACVARPPAPQELPQPWAAIPIAPLQSTSIIEPESQQESHIPKARSAPISAPLTDYEMPRALPKSFNDALTWATGFWRQEFREDLPSFQSIVPQSKYRSFLPKPRDPRELIETDVIPESYLRAANPTAIEHPLGLNSDRPTQAYRFNFKVPELDASTEVWESWAEALLMELRAAAPRSVANDVALWAQQPLQLRISESQCYSYLDSRLFQFDLNLSAHLQEQLGSREVFSNRITRLSREALQHGKHIPARKLLYMIGIAICRDESNNERLAAVEWAGVKLHPSGHGIKSLTLLQIQTFFNDLIHYLSPNANQVSNAQVEQRVEETLSLCGPLAPNLRAYRALAYNDPQRNWQFFPSLIQQILKQKVDDRQMNSDTKAFSAPLATPATTKGKDGKGKDKDGKGKSKDGKTNDGKGQDKDGKGKDKDGKTNEGKGKNKDGKGKGNGGNHDASSGAGSRGRSQSPNKMPCSRCGRTNHTIDRCVAKFHADGSQLADVTSQTKRWTPRERARLSAMPAFNEGLDRSKIVYDESGNLVPPEASPKPKAAPAALKAQAADATAKAGDSPRSDASGQRGAAALVAASSG